MAKINCEVNNCSHNKAGECYANCIDIAGSSAKRECNTCCSSFLDSRHYSELTNNILRSGACDCLKCTVESCRFNDNHLCALEQIQVTGTPQAEYYTQTECSSFRLRDAAH